MRKNSHDRILKTEPEEQHLSTVLKYDTGMAVRHLKWSVHAS